mgnify:CR=1 FL=1
MKNLKVKIQKYGKNGIRKWGYVLYSKNNTHSTTVYPLLFGYCLTVTKINPKGFLNPDFVSFINREVIK